jgi:hypothetical protein
VTSGESVGSQLLARIGAALKAGARAGLKAFGVWLAALFVYGVLMIVACVFIAAHGSRAAGIVAGVLVLIGSIAVGLYVSAQRAIGRGASAAIVAGGLCSRILDEVGERLPTFGAEETLDAKRAIVVAKIRELTSELTTSSESGASRWLRKTILTRVVRLLIPRIQTLEDVELTPENLGRAVGGRLDRTIGEAISLAASRTSIIVLVIYTIAAPGVAYLLSLL